MGIFKKKEKEKEKEIPVKDIKNKATVLEVETDDKKTPKSEKKTHIFDKGMREIKDILAPGFDRSKEDSIKVGNKFVRNFIVNGYPNLISVGWLDKLYMSENDLDVSLHILPVEDRKALDELTEKITQFESQYLLESQKGNIRNLGVLQAKVSQLYQQRSKLEQNYENLFQIQIVATLYTNSYTDLEKESERLKSSLKGQRIEMLSMYLQQDEAYKSGLPFGESFVPDKFRNFNTGALTACFPFYHSEISHKNGVFIGINNYTNTPVLIDFYDRNLINNGNATVFGQAGSGKTFFVSLLTLRSALKGIRTVIIDPEGEYVGLAKMVGGASIEISPNSDSFINPFDIEEEYDPDIDDYIVRVKQKSTDILNLLAVMVGGMSREQQSFISSAIISLYRDVFEINEDPQSLLDEDGFDAETGAFIPNKKKLMPTLSDFHQHLLNEIQRTGSPEFGSIYNSLKMYVKGGTYDLFDQQTSPHLREFKSAPIVNFDISKLEDSILRPIGMYIALSWAWEKFAKKNIDIKKRIICDEAWMLVNRNMAGSEYTSTFLEQCARRIRKRNGGLFVASQNFLEFYESNSGKAVLTNAAVNIFLRQNATDIDYVQNVFKLSSGERQFLVTAKKGEMLIKLGDESSVTYALPFKAEQKIIDEAKAILKKNSI